MSVPVMSAESSLARNRAVEAISSALPVRRSRMVLLMVWPVTLFMVWVGVDLGGRVGLDEAGLDDVAADAPVGVDVDHISGDTPRAPTWRRSRRWRSCHSATRHPRSMPPR